MSFNGSFLLWILKRHSCGIRRINKRRALKLKARTLYSF